jgi:hypothetical protein
VNWTSYTKVRSPLAIAGQSCAARIPGAKTLRAVARNVREAIVRIITARPGHGRTDVGSHPRRRPPKSVALGGRNAAKK